MMLSSVIVADAIQLSLSSQQIGLGEPVKVSIQTNSPIKYQKIKFLNELFEVFLAKKSKRYFYEAYIGASRKQDPGDYVLHVDVTCKNKERLYQNYKITLDYPKVRKKGAVKLTKSTALSKRTDDYRKEGALLTKKFNIKTNKKYFKGPFLRPAVGRISSDLQRFERIITVIQVHMQVLILLTKKEQPLLPQKQVKWY